MSRAKDVNSRQLKHRSMSSSQVIQLTHIQPPSLPPSLSPSGLHMTLHETFLSVGLIPVCVYTALGDHRWHRLSEPRWLFWGRASQWGRVWGGTLYRGCGYQPKGFKHTALWLNNGDAFRNQGKNTCISANVPPLQWSANNTSMFVFLKHPK